MTKVLFYFLAVSLLILPLGVLASPGPIDQYGGHVCLENCPDYGLANGQYHYHAIPQDPDFLTGYIQKPKESYLYFLPLLKKELITKAPATLDNELVENAVLDNSYCGGLGIFAKGYYTKENLVRIKPVCADKETAVMTNANIITNLYYKELPNLIGNEITKLYHYNSVAANKDVFTDRPQLSELNGQIIQGQTDPAMFYVKANGFESELRKISEGTAQFMYGLNYQDHIIYFDDSIIYSFKIGVPL